MEKKLHKKGETGWYVIVWPSDALLVDDSRGVYPQANKEAALAYKEKMLKKYHNIIVRVAYLVADKEILRT